jgi:hypothetical protein
MSEATSEKEDPKIPPRQFFQHTNVYNCMVDESAPVETQLEQLKARYIALAHNIGQFFDEEEFLTSHTPDEWARTMPAYWPKEFHYAWYCAGAFSHNWAYKSLSDMKWTKAQKKQLVASLDGYIVQEDFDSIISRLSHRDCSGFPDRLATAFLMKRVIKEFFQHPFWYVEVLPEGRGISGDAEWQGVSPYGVVLEDLFAQFQTGTFHHLLAALNMPTSCPSSNPVLSDLVYSQHPVCPHLAQPNDPPLQPKGPSRGLRKEPPRPSMGSVSFPGPATSRRQRLQAPVEAHNGPGGQGELAREGTRADLGYRRQHALAESMPAVSYPP